MKQFIGFLFSITFITCQELALSTSQLIYQPMRNSEMNIQVNYAPNVNTMHFSWGMQWWPSPNLYISGVLDTQSKDDDDALYHNFSLGYANPQWRWLGSTANSIELGLHRYRFSTSSPSRWFSVVYRTRQLGGKFGLGADIINVFFNDWSAYKMNTVLIWMPSEKLYIEGGVSWDDQQGILPILNISVGL